MAVAEVVQGVGLVEPAEAGQWALVWRRLRRHRLAMLSLAAISLLVLIAVCAPLIAPYPYDQLNARNRVAPPSAANWLGTDELGRDILSRLIWAGRISITVAVVTTVLSTVFGTLVGAVAGYFGGTVDAVLMRLTDMMLAQPQLALLLILSKILGPGVETIIVVLTVFGWMPLARLVRGSVLSLREQEFIEACRAAGIAPHQVIVRHLVPNSIAPIIVSATLHVGNVIIAESTLSFLGLGIVPPTPSWGNMLNSVQEYMFQNPALAFYPGIAIFITVLAFNYLGDGLRDALDPRLKQ